MARDGRTASELQLEYTPWRTDRRLGFISLCMWAGTEVRVYDALTPWENMQSLLAMAVIFVLVVAWPTWGLRSYLRWRLSALSFLRVFLIALPFNFSTAVFDAIAPNIGTGRLAVVSNCFHVFLAIRIALLTFTSLGWRVPFRLHLVLQSINVGIFARFGLIPYCSSKFMSSAPLQATAAALHKGVSVMALIFLPNISVLGVPENAFTQRAAFVLFLWIVLGWLLPTLLLLPEARVEQRRRQGTPTLLDRAEDAVVAMLSMLLPPRMHARADEDDQSLHNTATWLLLWWVVALVAWWLSCCAAALTPAAAAAAAAPGA